MNDGQAYTAPMLVTLAGRRQILVVSARRAMGLGVEDGSLLWDYPWRIRTVPNIAQPVVLNESRVFLSASYGHGAAVFEVTRSDSGFEAHTIWQNKRMRNKLSSSVLHQGYIYGLDESILACVDAETGERKWKGGRYGYGQLLLASDYLIVLSESGDVVLVKATPERHEELARFSAIKGKTWNVPAIADGCLLVRNTTQMACFDISLRQRTSTLTPVSFGYYKFDLTATSRSPILPGERSRTCHDIHPQVNPTGRGSRFLNWDGSSQTNRRRPRGLSGASGPMAAAAGTAGASRRGQSSTPRRCPTGARTADRTSASARAPSWNARMCRCASGPLRCISNSRA